MQATTKYLSNYWDGKRLPNYLPTTTTTTIRRCLFKSENKQSFCFFNLKEKKSARRVYFFDTIKRNAERFEVFWFVLKVVFGAMFDFGLFKI